MGLQNILPILGSLIYGPPQQNTGYEGLSQDPTTGKWVDPNTGMPSLPYRQPGRFEQLLAPTTAAEEEGYNRQATLAGPNALTERNIQKSLNANMFNDLSPGTKNLFPGGANEFGASHGYNNPMDTGTANIEAINQGFRSAGGIPSSVQNRLTSLATSTQDQSNLLTHLKALASVNEPYNSAINQGASTGLEARALAHEGDIQPTKFALDTAGAGNQLALEQGKTPTIPYLNSAALSDARTKSDLAAIGMQYDPTIAKAQAIGSVYGAEHPNIPADRFAATVDPNAGTIAPGYAMSPEMRASMNMIPGMANSMGIGTPGAIPSHTGNWIPKNTVDPHAPINPLNRLQLPPPVTQTGTGSSEPVKGNDEIDDVVKQLNDEHEKNGPTSPRYHALLDRLKELHGIHSSTNKVEPSFWSKQGQRVYNADEQPWQP